MDENFAERLRLIRERMGASGRKLSLELGLNANAWASYESGGSLPGSAVLHALCLRGVNLNWLMTGDGEPWWKSDGSDINTYIKNHDNQVYRHLGLGRLALIATRSTTAQKTLILKALLGSLPDTLSLPELCTSVGMTSENIVPVMMELVEEGMVEEVQSEGHGVYRAKVNSCWSLPTAKSDAAQVVLDAVEKLVKDVYPAAVSRPSSAVLMEGTIYIKDGKAWLKSLVEQVRVKGEEQHELGLDSITLVLGATIDET